MKRFLAIILGFALFLPVGVCPCQMLAMVRGVPDRDHHDDSPGHGPNCPCCQCHNSFAPQGIVAAPQGLDPPAVTGRIETDLALLFSPADFSPEAIPAPETSPDEPLYLTLRALLI